MKLAIIHSDNEIYIQMTPEQFEERLSKHLKDNTLKRAMALVVSELKKKALTK